MAEPHVTITLGRSGQKVVKESWGDGRSNALVPSGSKRSSAQSFGSSGADYSFHHNKRMREDSSGNSYGYNNSKDGDSNLRPGESRLNSKDLRVKLMRKRMSKRMELENQERKKVELHEKVSRAIQSMDSPDHTLSRNSRGTSERERAREDSIRSPYASLGSYGRMMRSPDMISGFSSGVSTPRGTIDELPPRVASMRTIDASRTGRVLMSDVLDSSRPNVPIPTTSRGPMDVGKVVTGLPSTSGGMSRPAYPEYQLLTVSGLLQSLGLGKYYINFQAEEIDMLALKQMGDVDLKELGVPMGPRKKILLALQGPLRRPLNQATQAHMNYSQILKL